jgi:hypothetical protein
MSAQHERDFRKSELGRTLGWTLAFGLSFGFGWLLAVLTLAPRTGWSDSLPYPISGFLSAIMGTMFLTGPIENQIRTRLLDLPRIDHDA